MLELSSAGRWGTIRRAKFGLIIPCLALGSTGPDPFFICLFSISRTELTSGQQVLTYTAVVLRGRSGLLRDDLMLCTLVFYLVKIVTDREVSGSMMGDMKSILASGCRTNFQRKRCI